MTATAPPVRYGKKSPKERFVDTLVRLSRRPAAELVVSREDECGAWCWILNYGNGNTAKVEGAQELPLPEEVVDIVPLLGKPYALLEYSTPSAAWNATMSDATSSKHVKAYLAPAHPAAVEQVVHALSTNGAPAGTFPPSHPNVCVYPNGLILYHDFLTPSEEARILSAIHASSAWGGPGRRKTMHFGPHFDYTTFAVSSEFTAVPEWLTFFLPRLEALEVGRQGGGGRPNQFTVQYYPPGTGIPPHVDTHSAFVEELWSLSLGCAVPMALRKCGKREARRMRLPKRSLGEAAADEEGKAVGEEETDGEGEVEEWDLMLPPRSLLLMTGAARYGYSHGIAPRKLDQAGRRVVPRQGRYSVTMRGVKEEAACECQWGDVCDAQIRRERLQAAAHTVS